METTPGRAGRDMEEVVSETMKRKKPIKGLLSSKLGHLRQFHGVYRNSTEYLPQKYFIPSYPLMGRGGEVFTHPFP